MYKENSWGIGPYFKYWNVKQSETNSAVIQVNSVSNNLLIYEPSNSTKEYGIKGIYRF
jgi:hypothetical protein